MEFIDKYIKQLTEAHKEHYAKNYPSLTAPTFTATYGRKYIKILIHSGQTSVHCFLDYDGNIYKASSYKVPAKGIRGNLKNDVVPVLCGDYYRIGIKYRNI